MAEEESDLCVPDAGKRHGRNLLTIAFLVKAENLKHISSKVGKNFFWEKTLKFTSRRLSSFRT